jgi:hypothetical protein
MDGGKQTIKTKNTIIASELRSKLQRTQLSNEEHHDCQ